MRRSLLGALTASLYNRFMSLHEAFQQPHRYLRERHDPAQCNPAPPARLADHWWADYRDCVRHKGNCLGAGQCRDNNLGKNGVSLAAYVPAARVLVVCWTVQIFGKQGMCMLLARNAVGSSASNRCKWRAAASRSAAQHSLPQKEGRGY